MLVSAFLQQQGVSAELLRTLETGGLRLCLAPEILAETRQTLILKRHIRGRFGYPDDDVEEYLNWLVERARFIGNLSLLRVVPRDPDDDMIVACAIKADADYIVTRDKHLLEVDGLRGIAVVTPEAFMTWLRGRRAPSP